MANNIKGITIELGGNTGPLTTALKDVNKTSSNLQSELREVNKQLKFDPTNTTLLTQKQDLLKQSTETLEEKQAMLKEAVSQAQEQFEKGDLGEDKVRAVEREYEKVNSQLENTKTELNNANSAVGTFSDKAKAKFSSLKDSIKSAFNAENVKTALGTIGVAVGSFLKSSISDAGEAEQINKDLEQTLESTGGAAGMTVDSLNDLADSLQKTTTFSADTVKEGEGMLLTFTNIGQDVFPQATEALLNLSQKMGTDVSTQAEQLGKALNDPVSGISALTRVGVVFTDQQKEQIQAMQAAGDTAGAQQVILDELSKEFGGQAAAAADTYAGKQQQLKNSLEEIKEKIGAALIPILQKLTTFAQNVLVPVAEFISEHPGLVAAILAVIAVIGTLVGGMSLLNTIMSAVGIIMEISVLGPILLIIAAIAALVAIVVIVVKNWSAIAEFFKNLWGDIVNIFNTCINAISGFFTGLWDGIVAIFQNVGNWFKARFTEAYDGITSVFSAIGNFFSGVWDGIVAIFQNVGNWFKERFTEAYNNITAAFSGIGKFFSGVWDGIVAIFKIVRNWFKERFTEAYNNITAAFSGIGNFFSGVWDGIVAIFKGVGNWFGDIFSKAWENIKSNFSAVGSFFSGVWNGITSVFKGVGNWFKARFTEAYNGITSVFSGIGKFFSGVWDGITSIFGKVGTAIGDAVSGAFKSVVNSVLGFVEKIVNSVIKGINTALDLINKIPGVNIKLIKEVSFTRMAKGGITQGETTATIGEDGQEAVLPLEKNTGWMDVIAQKLSSNVIASMSAVFTALTKSIDNSAAVSTAMLSLYNDTLINAPSKAQGGSDEQKNGQSPVFQQTINNYSPKALSPAETARQTRNATRQMVLALQKQ